MSETILLVEDDRDLSDVVAAYLKNEGFAVTQAYTGGEALERAKQLPRLVLLDIMLPEIGGIELCRRIRESSHAPIIMLSAKNTDMDKLLSLGMGADDYMTKPFSLPELAGRIRAHLRRYTVYDKERETRQYGSLTIDPKAYAVTVDGRPVSLTSKEFHLLDFLSSHAGQVFTKSQLMDEVWGYNEYVDENTIAVYIGRLREKLTKTHGGHVKTVWGVGYKWDE
ncbi:MAG: response regulator transcription factor [Oscillospiraceae bacterium]|nr:response regulator transcription factor [Oscillospiraceae bacterium]